MSLGKKDIFIEPGTKSAKKKLERSIATNKKFKKRSCYQRRRYPFIITWRWFQMGRKRQCYWKKIDS